MDNIKNDNFYIEKILEDLRFIVEHTKGITKESLEEDLILLDSMMFRLIQISESAKRLSEEFKDEHSTIPWTAIHGLRNKIVHDYGNVDLDIVFFTLTVDIPDLLNKIII